MTLKISEMNKGQPKAPRIEEGTYPGRLASIIDLGIQPMTDWKTGAEIKSKPRILITFELPTELIDVEDDEGNVTQAPRWISKEYTSSSFDQSNIVKLCNELQDKENPIDDISDLLGSACMVSVGSTVTGNAKVTNVIRAPASMPIDDLSREAKAFDFSEPDEDVFVAQPDWIQEKIVNAENYTGFADNWQGAQQ